MFDVFYSGTAPGLFAHEQAADSIEHARSLSRTRYFWWVNYLTDYAGWDFLWEPEPWNAAYKHAWPSQWQKDSGTYLIPAQGYTDTQYHQDRTVTRLPCRLNWTVPDTFDSDTFDWSWHPDPADPPYVYQFGTQHQRTGGPVYRVTGAQDCKYVSQAGSRTRPCAAAIYVIDHLDGRCAAVAAKASGNGIAKVSQHRYFDTYRDTLRRIARASTEEWIWVISSCCDYAEFDWTWHPEPWQAHMLHVFASSGESFGDTFFMHVPTFRDRIDQCELLEWYDLNFLPSTVQRAPMPVILHDLDSHVAAVKSAEWSGPLAVFATQPVEHTVTVPLWREQTRAIVPLSSGATQVIVPRAAVPYIHTQLYDYPHIDRTQQHLHADQPLDIVFISNSEPGARANLGHLLSVTAGLPNGVHHSEGVTGRVAAYHAAAGLSTTPWFFAVFAKLQVSDQFDWSWQPDRMQEPKHYIFHAHNPVTGLTYGHQAMIAYNRELVLNNPGTGLDFTLDSAHEVVPILSGTAEYASTPWMAWRTAFRECIKLRASTDVESQYRLNKWLTVGTHHLHGKYSIYGAEDAVEYYDSVAGDLQQLRTSYDWAWLASYALIRRNLIPDQ
jgi:hypothetical protein